MTDDRTRGGDGDNPGRVCILESKIGGYKALGNIKDENQSAPTESSLTDGVGRGGVTGAGIAHIHVFDVTRDPNGKGQ